MAVLNFNSNVQKLQAIASKDETRYNMTGVLIDHAKGIAVATDGHKMAMVKLDDTTDASEGTYQFTKEKPSKDVLRCGVASFMNWSNDIAPIYYDTVGKGTNGAVEKIDDQFPCSKFPPYEQVIVDHGNYAVVTLNAKYLLELAVALGSNDKKPLAITLQVPIDGKSPVYVSTDRDNHSVGVVMPIRREEESKTPLQRIKAMLSGKPEAIKVAA